MIMEKKLKRGLIILTILTIIAAILIIKLWLPQNQQVNSQIIVLNEEPCPNCTMGLINSSWQNNDLIIEGVFPINCCPGDVIYEYNVSNDNLTVVLRDEGLCNCMGKRKTTLKIQNLEKRDYNITLGYEFYRK